MVSVCIFVCVSGVEDKWSDSLITSAGPVGGAELQSGFSPFLSVLFLFSSDPVNLSHTFPAALVPSPL